VGLAVGTDLLGLFPWYFASAPSPAGSAEDSESSEEVVIVATSPELLRHHPLFPEVLDQEGLIGSLLLSGLIGNRTLLRGVRRLSAGCMLVARPDVGVAEIPCYRIPDGEPLAHLPFREQVEALDEAFGGAVKQQAPPDAPIGVLLSGGRDSRLLAGYLGDRRSTVTALTLGLPSDYEVECARAVARELRFEHEVVSLDPTTFPDAARLHAHWEHLATGFATAHMWSVLGELARLPTHFVTGYVLDMLLGTRPAPGREAPFDAAFQIFNRRRGIREGRLRRLLRSNQSQELMHGVIERARIQFDEAASDPRQRGWRFQLANTERHHPGTVPWRLSFASWPVMPFLDRRVLEVIGRLPAATLTERRAQDAILRTRFNDLARLPLDRNSHNTDPLILPRSVRIRRGLEARGILKPRRRGDAPDGQERRYFYRVYDFNGPGWVAIRRAAEPHRDRLADLFDMDELAKIVPAPDVPVPFDDVILDGFGPKMLVGTMLWAADHL
jgi:asparagine synthase (glutamine-hydrolysing)